MESKNRPCVSTVQDRQGRPLLVLVLHVQKYKPLHCSQHAGGVSGQKAEKTVETGLVLFLFLLSFLLFPLFSSKTDLLPWTLFSCLLTTEAPRNA